MQMKLRFPRNFLGHLLVLVFVAGAQSTEWNGTYQGQYNYGTTSGGSKILIHYAIEISGSLASIRATGFQTDDDIRCDARPNGSRVDLLFKSYKDGGTKNKYGVQQYKPGEMLVAVQKTLKDGNVNYRLISIRYGADGKPMNLALTKR